MISKLLKKNEKGFTLMEMLIVVAIIAVLVAIAIPTFTSSLNKAKVATDEANIRSGYASLMVRVLGGDLAGTDDKDKIEADTYYYLKSDGSLAKGDTTLASAYKTAGSQKTADLLVGGIKVGTWEANKCVFYKYATDGTVTITISDTTPTT